MDASDIVQNVQRAAATGVRTYVQKLPHFRVRRPYISQVRPTYTTSSVDAFLPQPGCH